MLVWEIERTLAEDRARLIIFYPRSGICQYPQVKGLTVMVNSVFNGCLRATFMPTRKASRSTICRSAATRRRCCACSTR
jgi:hypothetical protein